MAQDKISNQIVNSLPNDKILHWLKLEVVADDNSNVAKLMTLVFDRLENIVGLKENAGYQEFFFFPQYFQKASYSGSLKEGIVWESEKEISPFTDVFFPLPDDKF